MLGFGKKTCSFCRARVSTKDVWRAPSRPKGFVCRSCYEGWARAGKRCARRQTAVAGLQEVGAFFDHHTLGHADCGGLASSSSASTLLRLTVERTAIELTKGNGGPGDAKAMVAPIRELAFLIGVSPQVAESGRGLSTGHASSAPYED